MSKKKTQSASAFEMIKVRLRAERARLACSARSVAAETWLRAFYKNVSVRRTNTIKEQLFLPVRDSQLLVAVVENIGKAPETLSQMAADKHPEVRTAVADNPAAPVSTLMALAHDPDVDVRYCLAENNNLPSPVLSELTRDENPYVASRAQDTLGRRIKTAARAGTYAPFVGEASSINSCCVPV
ncbi:MAG: hypothetical protein Q8T09_23075 [Candidatus Melainabacteria bacterium]|nr:hypothetical protein [Candidatus Melainabacteria bacterium]